MKPQLLEVSGSLINGENSEEAEDPDRYSPFFYLWILCSIASSLYAYTWDIKMDWGLLDRYDIFWLWSERIRSVLIVVVKLHIVCTFLYYRNAGENKFLREEIVYSSKSYYYFAIIEDFVLRFGWAVSLSLTEMGFSMWGDLITSVLSPLEVFRRFIWNFFRLENEHLNNCGKYELRFQIGVNVF